MAIPVLARINTGKHNNKFKKEIGESLEIWFFKASLRLYNYRDVELFFFGVFSNRIFFIAFFL